MRTLPTMPVKYHDDIQKAALYLKNKGCEAVYLFGSMVTGKIHAHSDIDIGVKGLPPEKFFKTYAELHTGFDTEINLVDFDSDSRFFSLLEKLDEVVQIG